MVCIRSGAADASGYHSMVPTTSGVAQGAVPTSRNFPDAQGFCACVNRRGEQTFELQESDVVCIRSAAADDDGLHSLVQISGASHHLPPLATVTLESVQEAGEWEVRGLRVQRRLFTVRVAFRERA